MTADEVTHDLVGASVDRLDAPANEGARDGVLADVAVAAEKLQASVQHSLLECGGPPLLEVGETGPHLTEDVLAGHHDVVEEQLGDVFRALAELVQPLAGAEPRSASLDDEKAERIETGTLSRPGGDDEHVRHASVGPTPPATGSAGRRCPGRRGTARQGRRPRLRRTVPGSRD